MELVVDTVVISIILLLVLTVLVQLVYKPVLHWVLDNRYYPKKRKKR